MQDPQWRRWPGVIAHYARYLPVSEATPIVTLNEGNTPLIRADNFVEPWAGVSNCISSLKV